MNLVARMKWHIKLLETVGKAKTADVSVSIKPKKQLYLLVNFFYHEQKGRFCV